MSSSVLTVRGRPRRRGVAPVSGAEGVGPPSSPVDWSSRSSSAALLLSASSASCLLLRPRFLPGGRPRGLEGLAGVGASGGLAGASTLGLRPLRPVTEGAWLLWPLRWAVLWEEELEGETEVVVEGGGVRG